MILLLHNRYRTPGGEERAVADLEWLIPRELGEEVRVVAADSQALGARDAARGLLRGGTAIDAGGARVVHAHNVHPVFGRRALESAREQGARVVWHLHNYRLVCAVGTCFTRGSDCTRCHGRNTLPGAVLGCRGSRAEGAVYAAGLALQQRRLAAAADAFVVPSAFARDRLLELGAPLGDRAHVIASVQREFAERSRADSGTYALAAGRLSPEKGFADAIDGCARAGVRLLVAGDGPHAAELRAAARGDVEFLGHVSPERLAELRAGAALAIVPSRYEEILPLAALEAMAAGLPVAAAAAGGLRELVPAAGHYPPGDPAALAERVSALYGDTAAGDRALAIVRERCSPAAVGAALRAVYDA